jgi:hypothetical protein
MGPIDAFWHLANLIAPGLGLGLIAAALAKLLWRRELAAVPWRRLATWAASASTVVLLGGGPASAAAAAEAVQAASGESAVSTSARSECGSACVMRTSIS